MPQVLKVKQRAVLQLEKLKIRAFLYLSGITGNGRRKLALTVADGDWFLLTCHQAIEPNEIPVIYQFWFLLFPSVSWNNISILL